MTTHATKAGAVDCRHGEAPRFTADGGFYWVNTEEYCCTGTCHELPADAVASWNKGERLGMNGEVYLDTDAAAPGP